ncbi:hypothetical protein D3C72_2276500 [compost metagenome]
MPLQPRDMRIVLSRTSLFAVSHLPRGLWRITTPVTLSSTVLPWTVTSWEFAITMPAPSTSHATGPVPLRRTVLLRRVAAKLISWMMPIRWLSSTRFSS